MVFIFETLPVEVNFQKNEGLKKELFLTHGTIGLSKTGLSAKNFYVANSSNIKFDSNISYLV